MNQYSETKVKSVSSDIWIPEASRYFSPVLDTSALSLKSHRRDLPSEQSQWTTTDNHTNSARPSGLFQRVPECL